MRLLVATVTHLGVIEPHLLPRLWVPLDRQVRVDDPQPAVLLPAVVLPGAPQLLLHHLLVLGAKDVVPALEHGRVGEEGLVAFVVANVHHLICGRSVCVCVCVYVCEGCRGRAGPYYEATHTHTHTHTHIHTHTHTHAHTTLVVSHTPCSSLLLCCSGYTVTIVTETLAGYVVPH